jgi:hypothetical protein
MGGFLFYLHFISFPLPFFNKVLNIIIGYEAYSFSKWIFMIL